MAPLGDRAGGNRSGGGEVKQPASTAAEINAQALIIDRDCVIGPEPSG
jgi:hypothetical protein